MNGDYLDVRNAEGMPNLTDATIALDFMMAAKTEVRNRAIALTEAATPEVRDAFEKQLWNAVNMHEKITKFMMDKGWFRPYNLGEQFEMDMNSSKIAVQIAGLNLFSGNTSRLGTFATPEK